MHTHRHTRRNRHTLETPFCLAVVFVGLRPNPPPPPSHCWINRRGVGGWGHSARATLGQNKKKPQHKLTLGRGWRGSIFLKTDYLRSPLCSLSLSLPPPSDTSCSLGSCFDNADPQTRGVGWSLYMRVCAHTVGMGGSLIQEPSTCKSAWKHARLFLTQTPGRSGRAWWALDRKPCSFSEDLSFVMFFQVYALLVSCVHPTSYSRVSYHNRGYSQDKLYIILFYNQYIVLRNAIKSKSTFT